MYERANSEITGGLSFGARLLLGLLAILLGLVMVLAAPAGQPRAIWFDAFGVFCLLVAVACFTSGRARQFAGSLVGAIIFLFGVAYLVAELHGSARW